VEAAECNGCVPSEIARTNSVGEVDAGSEDVDGETQEPPHVKRSGPVREYWLGAGSR
jgi:hypothetical protein